MENKPNSLAAFPLAMLAFAGISIFAAVILSLGFAMEHPLSVALIILSLCSMIAAAVSLLVLSRPFRFRTRK